MWANRALLRFKDVCKCDLQLADINPNTWDVLVPDRDAWRHYVKKGALRAETKAWALAKHKWVARKKRQGSVQEATNYISLYQFQKRLPLKNQAFESLMRWPSPLQDEDAFQ